jgi:hypothetical protein
MITRASNVLDNPCGLDVSLDSTTPLTAVVVDTGYAYKSDMLIALTSDHVVDFTDPDHYVAFGTGFDETGYYYIVLEYQYMKSRPAPQAKLKIVRPSQRNNYDYGSSSTSLLFLKAVKVINVGIAQGIDLSDPLHDFDPTIPDNKREFPRQYAGGVAQLPIHDNCRDRGRFAYDLTTDQFYFGLSDRWELLNVAGTFGIDTTAVTVGDLCYVDSNGEAAAAISTAIGTGAEMIVVEVGTAATGTGEVRLSGYVQDVVVEATSPPILVGDLLYLSDTEAGSVTSTRPDPLSQVVGRALTDEAVSRVDILFFPRAVQETTTAVRITDLLSGVDWVLDTGTYRGDVDISGLGLSDQDVIVSCKDRATDLVISPQDVDLSVADTVRIWMPVNTIEVAVTVIG